MDNFTLSAHIERLESTILNIMNLKPEDNIINPSLLNLDDIKKCLNDIFTNEEISCTDVIYTLNTDKQYFGIYINPLLSNTDTLTILLSDEKFKLNNYQLELDSKLFDIGLEASEIVALIIYEVSSYVGSYQCIDDTRALIDLQLFSKEDVINIRDSVNYCQLINFGLKDTMYKVSSIMFKEDYTEIISNPMIQSAELQDTLVSAREKISNSLSGISDSLRPPKIIILEWVFMVYKDMKHNSRLAKETLNETKEFTASVLIKTEVDRTIRSIDQIDATAFFENVSINKYIENKQLYSLNEVSIFKSLKTSGLRGIEDAYYEYSLRAKSCETEDEAMYVLRGINTRLNILDDYLYNTPDISDNERKHWEDVCAKYRALRENLIKKKIMNKKQYGLFFDYDQLDNLDRNVD